MTDSKKSHIPITIIYLLVFLSGFVALVYQIVWQKYLETLVGSHALSATLVLSVFFGSLSLGSYFVGKWAKHISNQILVYAILEGLIGFYALLSLDWFRLLVYLFESTSLWKADALISGMILALFYIGPPVFLMGGTIPVITQGLSQTFQGSDQTHARVYAFNTYGAFLGAVLAGLFFIEIWGLPITLYHAAFVNFLVCFVGWILSKNKTAAFSGPKPERSTSKKTNEFFVFGTLAFLSGFVFFLIEGLVIRMAGLSLGSSTYTYSMVVGAFIFAIAMGSHFISKWKDLSTAKILFYYVFLFCSGLLLYLFIPKWPELFWRTRTLIQSSLLNFTPYWFLVCAVLILVLAVPIGILGMNLPILFNFFKNKSQHLNQTTGKMYSINALGSVLGALLSYELLRYFSASQVFKIALLGILLLVTLSFSIHRQDFKKYKKQTIYGLILALTVIGILPNWRMGYFFPGRYQYFNVPPSIESFGVFKQQMNFKKSKIIFYKDDPNTSVAVTQDPTGIALQVNGKTDAHSHSDAPVRSMNALFTTALANEPKSAFIIGLGGGLGPSIIGNLDSIEKIDICEISDAVIEAQKFFDPYNFKIENARKKYHLHRGDAYQILKSNSEQYDLIVSEPSNPWVTGVEKLFTIEFLTEISKHLKPNGIYGQWLPLFGMTPKTIEAILHGFGSVFSTSTLWSTYGGALLILNSNDSIAPDLVRLQKNYEQFRPLYEKLHFTSGVDILSHQILNASNFKTLSNLTKFSHTLENPMLQFEANRGYFSNSMVDINQYLTKILNEIPYDQISNKDPFLYEKLWSIPPESYFVSNLKNAALRQLTQLGKRRLGVEYALHYPENKKLFGPSPQAIAEIKALLNGDERYFKNKIYNFRDAQVLVQNYQNLKASQFRIKIKNFSKLIKINCENNSMCTSWIESLPKVIL